jgi:hypothetical protein
VKSLAGSRQGLEGLSSSADVAGRGTASGDVGPVHDAAEPFIAGMVIAPDDVPADHAGLLGCGCKVTPSSAEQRAQPRG